MLNHLVIWRYHCRRVPCKVLARLGLIAQAQSAEARGAGLVSLSTTPAHAFLLPFPVTEPWAFGLWYIRSGYGYGGYGYGGYGYGYGYGMAMAMAAMAMGYGYGYG